MRTHFSSVARSYTLDCAELFLRKRSVRDHRQELLKYILYGHVIHPHCPHYLLKYLPLLGDQMDS